MSPPWRGWSLRARLTAGYTVALGALLALLGAAALVLLERGLRTTVDQSLLSVGRTVAEMRRRPEAPGAAQLEEALDALLGPLATERFLRLLDPYGRPRAPGPRGLDLPLGATALENAAAGRETFETLPVPSGPVRVLTYPVVAGGRLLDVVQVAMPLAGVEVARNRFLVVLLGLAPVALAGVALGGWLLTGRALAPVDAMAAAARRIGAGDLAMRVPTDGRADELGRLAAVLNQMLERLERSLAAARQLSADAAHELRTPLTVLKGEIDVALRGTPSAEETQRVLGSLREEVERLAALVEDLLFLARSDAGAIRLPPEPVDLAALLDEAGPALRAIAERGGARLTVAPSRPLPVRGSAPLLWRVLLNLVENAVRHGGPGVTVHVALRRDDGPAELLVADDGPGIPPADQARIFDRFYRTDAARSGDGTGLGLALVRAIVELHRGQIGVESAPGRGSAFRVRLPMRESS